MTTTTAGNPNASADIVVEYAGFEDEPAAQAAFQRAVDIWAEHIRSSITITVNATFASEGIDDRTLGFATPATFRGLQSEDGQVTFFAEALANVLLGRDIEAESAEIETTFNSNFDWYYGKAEDGADRNEFDFTTVVLHELGHGLGFIGSMNVEEGQGSYGLRTIDGDIFRDNGGNVVPLAYDRFAEDLSGTSLLDEDVYPNPSEALADVLTDNDPDAESTVLFDGPRARLGAPVGGVAGSPAPKLFTPDEWNLGSSYSHLDEDAYPGDTGDPDALMTPQFGRQEVSRGPGGATCGIFEDIGWRLGIRCLAELGLADIELAIQEATVEEVTRGGQNQVRVTFREEVAELAGRFQIERCFGTSCSEEDFEAVSTIQAEEGQQQYSALVLLPTVGQYTLRVTFLLENSEVVLARETIDVRIEPEGDFVLTEAFPNPFQGQTALRLVTANQSQTGDVTAALYDSRGRRVRTLAFDGAASNGQRTLTIQAGSLASGVYHVRVMGEDFMQTRTVVLVR